ncbi:protein anoxia up-regulated isoform X4 [Drosophila albomicans]|uniref:Protein anoxia up-regulated isoform X4 n=1 Tax=Drosophila albomicans TaxID=7291 RepID=A0A6P8Z9P8_DROAB|nr:protein anoxia up-regulated isoform X4 [Drosophila albomicans]
MVYESGFTTRRTYTSRPVTTSYAVTTPRLDLCTSQPGSHRSRASSDYSYTSKSSVEKSSYDSSNPYSRPERSTYTSTVEKSSRNGPGGYNYSTERTSTTGAGPGGYSYSSTTSGNLPGGTKYRHFSYHV